jgi:hypothetical protein
LQTTCPATLRPSARLFQAELAAAQALGTTCVEVPLPDGGALHVALGQEQAVNAADGREYGIKWAQDDAGRLVVLDVLPLGAGHGAAGGAGRGGQLGVVVSRPSGAGVRRRGRSGTGLGLVRRSRSISQLLASGIDLLLGNKSHPPSVDSDSSGDSSFGGTLSSAAPSASQQRGGGGAAGGGGARGRGRSSSGGGAAAAELGERGFRLSAPTGLFGARGGPHLRQQ